MKGIVSSQQIARFLIVWWIHVGLYLGLLVSVVWIIVDSARLRKRQLASTSEGCELFHGLSTGIVSIVDVRCCQMNLSSALPIT